MSTSDVVFFEKSFTLSCTGTSRDCQTCEHQTITYYQKGKSEESHCLCPFTTYPEFVQVEEREEEQEENEKEKQQQIQRGFTKIVKKCHSCPIGAQCMFPGSYGMNITDVQKINVTTMNGSTNVYDPRNWMKADQGYWKIPWETNPNKMFVKCLDEELCLEQDQCTCAHST